ncbi:hypothetical protein SARC_00483 [Sphaeroforma arctica JP610]|uniref:Uncharacterized protein n=1 Tax=Sphaeroforma arctica JP610 TaxID=667725 RepID=A0A0L0GEU4_9EUKA|nr:hypothetical protein SARC_00483 [Sphaeroforma arctica JP610]KNC87391.1 hypothetical protein SARC_00483 [Sphaeroforma arctica JP610]|eukprot:XP_014161293.1 hypothetical protein SARC_00483 [Sphaeroforma arctica JP610]
MDIKDTTPISMPEAKEMLDKYIANAERRQRASQALNDSDFKTPQAYSALRTLSENLEFTDMADCNTTLH